MNLMMLVCVRCLRCLMSVSFSSLTFFTATVVPFKLPPNTAPCEPAPSHCRLVIDSKGISQSSWIDLAMSLAERPKYPQTGLKHDIRPSENDSATATILNFDNCASYQIQPCRNLGSSFYPSVARWDPHCCWRQCSLPDCPGCCALQAEASWGHFGWSTRARDLRPSLQCWLCCCLKLLLLYKHMTIYVFICYTLEEFDYTISQLV